MHGRIRLAAVAGWLLAISSCISPSAFGQESREPFIRFIDDLFCWGQAQRDPWEERIETDRHDFTQSAKTVGYGVAQLEMGYSYFYLDEQEEIEQSHTGPELMLRLGVSEDIEFRLRWNYIWQSIDGEHGGEHLSGSEDLRWAFKLDVTGGDGWVPESAIELRFTAPLGSEEFSTNRVDWGIDYIYDWRLTERWRIYGSTGVMADGLADFGLLPDEPASDRFLVWTQSVALETELTERTTIYNEVYGLFSQNLEDDYRLVFYNVGVDYYLTDDIVLDVRVGKGLTSESDDFFAGVGGGVRF